jgi:hypothetical protein
MKYQHMITGLCSLLLVLVAGNQLFAWVEPSAIPPGSNVDAPLNTGTVGQVKSGNLVVNTLGTMGNVNLMHDSPRVRFTDELGGRDMWLLGNDNRLYLRADRDNADNDSEGRDGFSIFMGIDQDNDYAEFSNQVRATEYCDRTGENCSLPGDEGTGFKYMGASEVRNLKAGEVYLFFVTGSAQDRSGAVLTPCADTSRILAQTRQDTITGRTIQDSHMLPVRVPSGVSCIKGFVSGSNRWEAEYAVAIEASASSYVSTYYWDIGSYGSCSVSASCGQTLTGTRSRSVVCRNGINGNIVADSNCPSPKPATSQSCTSSNSGGQCNDN